MYGYIKPFKPELKVREWETYHAVYCGLCATLKQRFGFAARFTVNYDFTFLIMLLAEPGESPDSRQVRCPGTLRKRAHVFADQASDVAADLTLILAYHKLRDSLADDGFFKNLFVTRLAMMVLSKKYKKAAEIHRLFAENSQNILDELAKMEHNREKSVYKAANSFGNLLAAAGIYFSGAVNQRVAENLLRCIGKIVYLLDAADDLPDDRKHGRYNPLLYSDADCAELRSELTRLTAEAAADFELLPANAFHSVLENIFYLGIHRTIESVLNKGNIQ